MAGIGISRPVSQTVSIHQFDGSADQQWADDGVRDGIIPGHDFSKRSLEQVADRNPLADMQIAMGIHVHTLRMAQFFPLAFGELMP